MRPSHLEKSGSRFLNSRAACFGIGDRLTGEPASSLSLAVDGPEATDLPAIGDDNLVLRAARLLAGKPLQSRRISLTSAFRVGD